MDNQKASPHRKTALRLGAVLGAVTLTTLGIATPSYAVPTPDTITLSSLSGPSAGGNTITLTSSGGNNPYVAGSVFVEFQWDSTGTTACTGGYGTPAAVAYTANATSAGIVAAGNVRILSTNKLAVQVPASLVLGSADVTVPYSVCVYNTTGAGSLISKPATPGTNYTIGPTPTTIGTITPAIGPSQGGNTVVITGTGFVAAGTTASIAGIPLTGITATTTTITGTVPAHGAGGPYAVTVQVTGGANISKRAMYTYTNGLVVNPNTGANTNTASTDISVVGSNFNGLNFSTTTGPTPDDGNAHVYLVKGNYDPTKTTAGTKTNGEVTECENVLVVSDNELICSLYLAGNGIAQATLHSVTGTTSGTVLTATVGSFTQGDVGMAVTGATGLGTGNYIASVTDATHAVLAKAPTSAISTATVLSVAPNRTFTGDVTLANGSNVITSTANAQFTSADVGRTITGTNIPGSTTIASVTTATTATLSANASGTASGTYTISYAPTPVPVPNGPYVISVVSNGNIDAQPGGTKADPNYYRTAVTSGSSFTVADF
jgi:hypothetical protein